MAIKETRKSNQIKQRRQQFRVLKMITERKVKVVWKYEKRQEKHVREKKTSKNTIRSVRDPEIITKRKVK